MWPQLHPSHTILNSALSDSFYVNLNHSGSVVIQKKIFEEFSHWNTCKIVSNIVASPDPQDHDCTKFDLTLCQDAFM
jgi:hypothetical protein